MYSFLGLLLSRRVSMKMIFTPKGTEILFLHLNAEKKTKGIISQSVFWGLIGVTSTDEFGNC